ncbi:MAG TPA: Bax inhibitor-1/YccA family protein [Stellaceae bacterium]|nr:Bax inhibitor-1/YccA family protein [Stellaceae bacterium]
MPEPEIASIPARRHGPEADSGLRRYMLGVYGYVACGLAVTGLAAVIVTFSGFHAAMMDRTPAFLLPFIWVLLLAPLGLVLLLWFSIDEMSLCAAQATAWTCSALTGFTFECISLVYTGTSLVPVLFAAAAMFAALSAYGYAARSDLSISNHFLGMAVLGVLLAAAINLFLGSTPSEFGLSVAGIIALVCLTAWDTKRIKEIYLGSDTGEQIGKRALIGALALYLDANPIVLLLRLETGRDG